MHHKRCVYFIRSGDAIKIGTTSNLQTRLPGIERDIGAKVELIGWVYGSFSTENAIHRHLAAHREEGEWFVECREVMEVINFLISRGPIFYGLPVKPNRGGITRVSLGEGNDGTT